jgi:phage terminase small subunit
MDTNYKKYCESVPVLLIIVERKGLIIANRYGDPKAHPANGILKDNRNQIMQALKELALTPVTDNDWVSRDFG